MGKFQTHSSRLEAQSKNLKNENSIKKLLDDIETV